MTLNELKRLVKSNTIDTVIVAVPDPFGRLVGKRFRADFFLNSVAKHGTHGCNYLITVNLDMDPLEGFKVANWDAGFGDFEMRPDLSTLRALPWQPGAVFVLCDFLKHDGKLVAEAPRSVLRRQLDLIDRQGASPAIAPASSSSTSSTRPITRPSRRATATCSPRATTGSTITSCSPPAMRP